MFTAHEFLFGQPVTARPTPLMRTSRKRSEIRSQHWLL